MQAYTVVSGDTLSKIASKFSTSIPALVTANGIADPNKIYVGQTIIIPDKPALAAPPKPSATVNVSDDVIQEVVVTARRPAPVTAAAFDLGDWLKPPKLYGVLALAAIGVYLLTRDD